MNIRPCFRKHRRGTGVKHRIEIHLDTEHGFAFPQRPAYNKDPAERHWERMFALFDRRLRIDMVL